MKPLLIILIFTVSPCLISLDTDLQAAISSDSCQDVHQKSYSKCSRKTRCTLCASTMYCASCVPINAADKSPLCGESCGEIISIDRCFSAARKKISEEIDLENNYYEKPQFEPRRFEREHYRVRADPDEVEEIPEQEGKAKAKEISVSQAKKQIFDFLDKLTLKN